MYSRGSLAATHDRSIRSSCNAQQQALEFDPLICDRILHMYINGRTHMLMAGQ